MTTKPKLVINNVPTVLPWPDAGSPVERARARYGKAFAHEPRSEHVHTSGPSYWTAERVSALAAENAKRRERK